MNVAVPVDFAHVDGRDDALAERQQGAHDHRVEVFPALHDAAEEFGDLAPRVPERSADRAGDLTPVNEAERLRDLGNRRRHEGKHWRQDL